MERKTFFILLMTSFSAMVGIGVISPFLPLFATLHGANGFWLGMIFAGYGFSRGIIMPIVGRVSDKIGRKVFVTSGLLLYTIITLFYPIAEGVVELTVLRLFHGFALGMIMPIVMAYVGDFARKGKEAATVSALNMMFYMGLAVGPLMGGIIDQYYGFDAVFHLIAILGAINFLIVLFLLPDSKSPAPEKVESFGQFGKLIKHSFIKAVLLIAVITILMMVVFISFVPSLAEEIDMNTAHIGFLIFLGIFVAGILQVPFGKLADRFDRYGKSFQVCIGITVGMFALLAMPFCPEFPALLVAGVFVGVGTGIAVPALSGIHVEIGQKAGMGTWMGIVQAAYSLAFVVTPIIFGLTMDHLGIHCVFYLVALICLFGGLAFYCFVRKRMKDENT